MLWLRMALVSEGVSDDAFLPTVLQRSAQEICPAGTQVEDVLVVRAARGPAPTDAVVRALEGNRGAFRLIVVHHDADSDPENVQARWVAPLRARWRAAGNPDPVVGVVPVRETETWALADRDVLCRMLGRPRDPTLGLPSRGVDLERLQDPKQTLRDVFVDRRQRWDAAYLTRLGELVSLERLRELPAFQSWENDLAEALRTLPGFAKGWEERP